MGQALDAQQVAGYAACLPAGAAVDVLPDRAPARVVGVDDSTYEVELVETGRLARVDARRVVPGCGRPRGRAAGICVWVL